MKILVAGGTGFVGRRLLTRLLEEGHQVVLLTRDPEKAQAWHRRGAQVRSWADPSWPRALEGQDAVVNLAGEGIADGRWTAARKRRILRSRVDTTRALADAMASAAAPPTILVNASAVGFYGPRGAEALDEAAAPGRGFLAQVCEAWEREALRTRNFGTRVVLLRIGVVLGREGGALKRMLPPFKLGLGGRLGSGTQWFPWIHADDVVGLIVAALQEPALDGPVNAVSPQAATNAEFTRALGRALGRPAVIPVPAPALRLLLGEMSEMLLGGQLVLPRAAQKAGYRFKYPSLEGCLKDAAGG